MRIRWERIGRVLLIVVLLVVAGLYLQRGITYLSVRSQAEQQQAIVARLHRQNAALIQQAKQLSDPGTIEREARELGMVRPGERPYVVTGLPGG